MQPFVIHAHFYQPERTNPWTGVLDPEPSAAPARDWNQRIHGECYRPNGTARIFDDQRRVERIVNNYERLSFNFGPTLLRWMARRVPETYAKVLDGDWRSASANGHGNALAQAYNHMILPLANERDLATQIRWGLADFRYRFRREAEGLWLPETAANRATIDALIDAGVGFTVLAPHQAHRVRSPGGEWREVGAAIETGRAYRHLHSDGSGRSLAIFFYDGALAQGFAFDPRSTDSDVLLRRIREAVPHGGGLVHAALDGETFGHHRHFGELGLAYALFEQAEREGLRPTSYAAYLAEHPPTDEVEIVGGEGTAWSCSHGVGRWARDCGCATDSQEGWNQAWREPLRAALDVVRDAAVEAFEDRGSALLRDPWAARDAYIDVRLGTATPAAFLERHRRRALSDRQKTEVWTLLEAQRHAMVMYTSCGWFFADVSGIETVYVLRSAARVLGLLEEAGAAGGVRASLLEHLAEARSNKPDRGTGADVWQADVETAAVTPRRIVAHLALQALARPEQAMEIRAAAPLQVAGHSIAIRDGRVERRGRLAMAVGRVSITDDDTGRAHDLVVAGLHLGGIDFYGVTAPDRGEERYLQAAESLWAAFPTEPMPKLIRRISQLSGGAAEEFDLSHSLPGGRQLVVGTVFADLTNRFHEQYSRLYNDHRRVLEMLTAAGYALPRDVRVAAELTLDRQLERELEAAVAAEGNGDPSHFDQVLALVRLARSQGYELELSPVREALRSLVEGASALAARSLSEADADRLERWLDLAADLGIDLDLSRPQEQLWDAATRARKGRLGSDEITVVARLGARLGLAPRAWTPGL
jgi:alpha-amylase/alpha-mannosidase (GH57 family)